MEVSPTIVTGEDGCDRSTVDAETSKANRFVTGLNVEGSTGVVTIGSESAEASPATVADARYKSIIVEPKRICKPKSSIQRPGDRPVVVSVDIGDV